MPTADRVREALSRLGVLDGSVVLDLFAGTGALGSRRSRGVASGSFSSSESALRLRLRGPKISTIRSACRAMKPR